MSWLKYWYINQNRFFSVVVYEIFNKVWFSYYLCIVAMLRLLNLQIWCFPYQLLQIVSKSVKLMLSSSCHSSDWRNGMRKSHMMQMLSSLVGQYRRRRFWQPCNFSCNSKFVLNRLRIHVGRRASFCLFSEFSESEFAIIYSPLDW